MIVDVNLFVLDKSAGNFCMILNRKIDKDGKSLHVTEFAASSISQVDFKWEQCFVEMMESQGLILPHCTIHSMIILPVILEFEVYY